jgi:MoxR-like ATPase
MTGIKESASTLEESYAEIRRRLSKRIVGMDEVIKLLFAGIFSGGHCLLVGVPGLAKTRLISSVAQLIELDFSRIQFTPDLMPSDITGAEVIVEDKESGERNFRFLEGPIFANIVLADEINRTPPKTQAALMEAMEERQVSALGNVFPMGDPFFVLATQNPIEQEGTYPLPAAQLDRFVFNINVGYPAHDEETEIIRMTTRPHDETLEPVLNKQQVLDLMQALRQQANSANKT